MSEGCSLFPNGEWAECCTQHDDAWDIGRPGFMQSNSNLLECIADYNEWYAVGAFAGVTIAHPYWLYLRMKDHATKR